MRLVRWILCWFCFRFFVIFFGVLSLVDIGAFSREGVRVFSGESFVFVG